MVARLSLSGATLSLNDGTGEDLAVNGTFTWYGGVLSGAGSAIINTGATCALGNPANQAIGTLQATFTNNGTVNMVNNYFFSCCSATTFNMTGGTINNNGVFNVNTYSGLNPYTISGGTFNNNASGTFNCEIGDGSKTFQMLPVTFVNDGAVNVNAGGKLIIGPSNSSTHSGTFYSNSASGLEFINAGQTFNSSSSFTGTGLVTFNGGTHNINGSFTTTSTKVSNGSALFNQPSVSFGTLIVDGGTLGGAATKTVTAAMQWYGGIISGGSITINSGVVCALGNPANQAIGTLQATFTNNGTVNMVNNYFFSCCSATTFNMTGGTMNNNGVFNVNTYSGLNPYTISGGTFNNNAGATFNSLIGDASKEFRMFTTAFSNSGSININGGRANFGSYTIGGNFNIASGALVLGGPINFNGNTFSNNGSINHSGGTLTNSGTYKGNGAFSGTLFTNASSGHVAPGNSPGCQTFSNGFTTSGALDIEINGKTTACTDYDRITVTGTATLSDTLNVTIGYTPVDGDSVTIIVATSLSGTFGTFNARAGWTVNYNVPSTGRVTLIYTAPATLNDYRTINSGTWELAGTWQRYNGTSWVAAATAPTSADGTITYPAYYNGQCQYYH